MESVYHKPPGKRKAVLFMDDLDWADINVRRFFTLDPTWKYSIQLSPIYRDAECYFRSERIGNNCTNYQMFMKMGNIDRHIGDIQILLRSGKIEVYSLLSHYSHFQYLVEHNDVWVFESGRLLRNALDGGIGFEPNDYYKDGKLISGVEGIDTGDIPDDISKKAREYLSIVDMNIELYLDQLRDDIINYCPYFSKGISDEYYLSSPEISRGENTLNQKMFDSMVASGSPADHDPISSGIKKTNLSEEEKWKLLYIKEVPEAVRKIIQKSKKGNLEPWFIDYYFGKMTAPALTDKYNIGESSIYNYMNEAKKQVKKETGYVFEDKRGKLRK